MCLFWLVGIYVYYIYKYINKCICVQAWSNERIPSCEHQVIMKENKKRYSLGLFSFNSGMISVPQELVDDQHPLRYKPFNCFDYLRFTQTEESMNSKCAIKSYCGV